MTIEALATPSTKTRGEGHAIPVAVICLVVLVVWYLAAIPMNWVVTARKIEAAGGGFYDILALSWNERRPVIPAPVVFTTIHGLITKGWIPILNQMGSLGGTRKSM